MGREWRTDEDIRRDQREKPRMVAEAWLIALILGAVSVFILGTVFGAFA